MGILADVFIAAEAEPAATRFEGSAIPHDFFAPSVCFHPEGQRAHEALRKVATSFSLQNDYA